MVEPARISLEDFNVDDLDHCLAKVDREPAEHGPVGGEGQVYLPDDVVNGLLRGVAPSVAIVVEEGGDLPQVSSSPS